MNMSGFSTYYDIPYDTTIAMGFSVNGGGGLIKLNGSIELAPIVGLSEVIVDIVETGSTLKENGLEVYEEIAPISARLIVNTVSMKLRQSEIEELIKKIEKNI